MNKNEAIKEHIARCGVSLIAVADLGKCSCCENGEEHKPHDPTDKKNSFKEFDDAFVYTIGHKEAGRPDMLFFCGPAPEEKAFNNEQQQEEIKAVASLINKLVTDWKIRPVVVEHMCQVSTGRLYKFVKHDSNAVAMSKNQYTIQTTNYYESEEYELLIAIPYGRHNELLTPTSKDIPH